MSLADVRGALCGIVVLLSVSQAAAFHDAGVANCGGCHVMHDGAVFPPNPDDAGLLTGESPSDVCLVCHAESAGVVLGPDPLLPPPEKGSGNFAFLYEDNLNDAADGTLNPIPGEAAGHSIVAPARGLFADSRHTVSPGGSFPSDRLGCTSCHNPHGNAEFRLLNGVGPVQAGLATFSYPAPDAAGIDLISGVESDGNHTAYRAGISAWCANCHGFYHDDAATGFQHPSDELMRTGIRNRYNNYDGDADPFGGTAATSYLAEVPFQDSAAAIDSTAGPSAMARVMCLSCHRAHASSAPHAGRWDFNVSRLGDDGVVSGSFAIPNPYASPNQGRLCAKCHAGIPGGGPQAPQTDHIQSISPGGM